jgi:hypothetical protein
MWPFKKKQKETKAEQPGLSCTFCRSKHTVLNVYDGAGQPNPVRTWRGQRYLTCRCLDCGRDFYIEEPQGGIPSDAATDEDMIDEAALQRAEEELKKQIEDEDDRMLK